ncbi:hypothetical protein KV450_005196 [Escherichia coli]|nr:hypothetical protein [Escherichia coli]EHS4131456.1 hypothetical protein [Escherichia coli]EHS4201494.1 hypothetical protein [Escherichia coli]EHS4259200.1 hypothetical protein [Escherichia coli]
MSRQQSAFCLRPGDLVADFFMGSGSIIKAALALGGMALSVELESERFEHTAGEIVTLADN